MCNKVKNIPSFFKQLPKLSEKMTGAWYYRGQNNKTYDLVPSAYRNGLKGKEDIIYTQVMTECAEEIGDIKYRNEIISKMQHYGVPTRLLDITANPLVALYFACDGKKSEDGAVFVIKAKEDEQKLFDSDVISILSCLPRFSKDEKAEILDSVNQALSLSINRSNDKQVIDDFNSHIIVQRLLHEVKKEKPAFENIINPKHLLNHYFFQPRKSNNRIIRQSGAFIIFGLGEDKIVVNEKWSTKQRNINDKSYKIIIDKDSKRTIIDQLSCFGISKATLYPELYKVAEFLKEKYQNY